VRGWGNRGGATVAEAPDALSTTSSATPINNRPTSGGGMAPPRASGTGGIGGGAWSEQQHHSQQQRQASMDSSVVEPFGTVTPSGVRPGSAGSHSATPRSRPASGRGDAPEGDRPGIGRHRLHSGSGPIGEGGESDTYQVLSATPAGKGVAGGGGGTPAPAGAASDLPTRVVHDSLQPLINMGSPPIPEAGASAVGRPIGSGGALVLSPPRPMDAPHVQGAQGQPNHPNYPGDPNDPGSDATATVTQRRRQQEEEEESEDGGLPDAIKLGLGDFIFYSMLVSVGTHTHTYTHIHTHTHTDTHTHTHTHTHTQN
jgi:hypothetical protein